MTQRTASIDSPSVPGLVELDAVVVTRGDGAEDAEAVGYVVFAEGEVPSALGLDRAALVRAGFDAKVGSTLSLPVASGPDLVAVGGGAPSDLTPALLRDVAAAFARAAARRARIALVVDGGVPDGAGDVEAAALVEGVLLARYGYTGLKSESKRVPLAALQLSLEGVADDAFERGTATARVAARAAVVARDLANTPPGRLTATRMAEVAVDLGATYGFDVEVFDKAALVELGCGGLLGVNQGSSEEPRMVKLVYRPAGGGGRHLGLVGKGIMYDSGGISLKPSDPMHLLMKMDMAGAAAVLGAFAALRDSGVSAAVTGWLMCTDNMPSGTAYKLGDVLVARDGTTVEVKNTDAEGRLVMMDALALAVEDEVDAILDIATLTGAALMALGGSTAPVFSNDDATADLVLAASAATDEPVWRLPLEKKYRPQLDSAIADMSNLGGPYAGATTAALFLSHFVRDIPWAHLDIAGTMQTEKDDSWRSAGATGFGARLLLHAAAHFGSDASA
ncbi:leucyl aminopeptidase family protein [Microbacterium sp. NPDC016588]